MILPLLNRYERFAVLLLQPTGAVLGSSLSYVTIQDVDKDQALREGYCNPTTSPTSVPSLNPSHLPTTHPTLPPTAQPSPVPTAHPTVTPTTETTTHAQVHSAFALAGVGASSVGPAERASLKASIVSSVAMVTNLNDIAALNVSDAPMAWPPGSGTSRRLLSTSMELIQNGAISDDNAGGNGADGSGGGDGGNGGRGGHGRELLSTTTYVYFTLAIVMESHPAYSSTPTGDAAATPVLVLSDLRSQLSAAVANGNLEATVQALGGTFATASVPPSLTNSLIATVTSARSVITF